MLDFGGGPGVVDLLWLRFGFAGGVVWWIVGGVWSLGELEVCTAAASGNDSP